MTETKYSALPGAEIALRVRALISNLDVDSYFGTSYSEHRWDQEQGKHVPAPPHFSTHADCSDTFWWGSADAETITEKNIDLLAQTIEEVSALMRTRRKVEETEEYRAGHFAENSAAYAAHVAECPTTTADGKHSNGRGCSPWTVGNGHPDFPAYAYEFETSISELFAARVRKMRPQGACFKGYPKEMWPLFLAAGPERETGMGNPHPIPSALV